MEGMTLFGISGGSPTHPVKRTDWTSGTRAYLFAFVVVHPHLRGEMWGTRSGGGSRGRYFGYNSVWQDFAALVSYPTARVRWKRSSASENMERASSGS
jgi:hypothetical protein